MFVLYCICNFELSKIMVIYLTIKNLILNEKRFLQNWIIVPLRLS